MPVTVDWFADRTWTNKSIWYTQLPNLPEMFIIYTHYIYRLIRNDCRGINNLLYTIHLR